MLGFKRKERYMILPEPGFEVVPGSEGTFREDVGLLVEDVVQDSQTQIGLSDVVNIRKNKTDARLNGFPIFEDLVVFSANVTTRFFNVVKDFFELMKVNCIQIYLSKIKFMLNIRKRNIAEVVFN